jgi:hypothetical protein
LLPCWCGNLAPLNERERECPSLAMGVPMTDASELTLLIVLFDLFTSGCRVNSRELTDTLSYSSSSSVMPLGSLLWAASSPSCSPPLPDVDAVFAPKRRCRFRFLSGFANSDGGFAFTFAIGLRNADSVDMAGSLVRVIFTFSLKCLETFLQSLSVWVRKTRPLALFFFIFLAAAGGGGRESLSLASAFKERSRIGLRKTRETKREE